MACFRDFKKSLTNRLSLVVLVSLLLLPLLFESSVYANDLSAVPENPTKASAVRSQSSESRIQLNQPLAAVAMPDQYSAMTAKHILNSGGNAVDAAVAAAFVLAVTYPEAGNLGGGGFMTLVLPTLAPKVQPSSEISQNLNRPVKTDNIRVLELAQHSENAYFLDYREKAPKAAFRDLYLDEKGEVIPYKSLVGYQASGVPGTVMGMWQVHQQFGSLPWRTLLQPAIHYAQNGFVVSKQMADTAEWFQAWIANKSTGRLNFADYFGELSADELFRQPDLANTLQRIAQFGAEDFYLGKSAQLLAKQMQENSGLISLQDLASYQAKWREPVMKNWRDKMIFSAPPPSSGGIALAQLLGLYDLKVEEFRKYLKQQNKTEMDQGAIRAHFYAELSKRVYADRAHFLGDPDFVTVPVDRLIQDSYLRQRAQEVNLTEISKTEAVKPGKIESIETTHFSIIDGQGNAVSNTYTLNMPFGNGVVIEGAGFLMNNEMDDFSTKPGVANIFGVVGAGANAIAPEKRMLSSMTPTILTDDKGVAMVVGSPGGSTIITSIFQTILNVYDLQQSAKQAIDAPRVHHQLLPKDQIAYHPDLPEMTKEALQLIGYTLKQNNYLGDVQLIVRDNDHIQAASDMRGRGVSEVFIVE